MNVFPSEMHTRLARSPVVAGFSVDQVEDAVPIARALWAGGIDAIELTLRTSVAIDAVRAICQEVPEVLVGVGTILTPSQLREVASIGADFGVSPGFNPRVVQAAREVGLPFAPGICTPSELEAAVELDCRLVKFFPAEACGGLNYLWSLAAPYLHLGVRFFPLGGLNQENMKAYLDEPAVTAIGGSWIVRRELVERKDWAGLTARAAAVRHALGQAGFHINPDRTKGIYV